MVIQLLALGRLGAEERPSRQAQVLPLQIQLFIHQAIQRMVLRYQAGDTAEIIDPAALLRRPLDHRPLEQIVGHQIPVLV